MAAHRNAEFDNDRKRHDERRGGNFERHANFTRKQRIREAREQEAGGARRNRGNFMNAIGYGGGEE